MKFKVGDRVKIVNPEEWWDAPLKQTVGKIGTIERINIGNYTCLIQLDELVEDEVMWRYPVENLEFADSKKKYKDILRRYNICKEFCK